MVTSLSAIKLVEKSIHEKAKERGFEIQVVAFNQEEFDKFVEPCTDPKCDVHGSGGKGPFVGSH